MAENYKERSLKQGVRSRWERTGWSGKVFLLSAGVPRASTGVSWQLCSAQTHNSVQTRAPAFVLAEVPVDFEGCLWQTRWAERMKR